MITVNFGPSLLHRLTQLVLWPHLVHEALCPCSSMWPVYILTALGLCCAWAFSSRCEQGLLCGCTVLGLLPAGASGVAKHGFPVLVAHGLSCPGAVGSSQTGDRTPVPCLASGSLTDDQEVLFCDLHGFRVFFHKCVTLVQDS